MARNHKTPDLQFSNHGFAVSCIPQTEVGRTWLEQNVGGETTSFGGALMIEPRYLSDIVEGARADGLVCKG